MCGTAVCRRLMCPPLEPCVGSCPLCPHSVRLDPVITGGADKCPASGGAIRVAVRAVGSKLALNLFTKAVAERGGADLLAASVHPGLLATDMIRNYTREAGRPVSEGAAAVLHWPPPISRTAVTTRA